MNRDVSPDRQAPGCGAQEPRHRSPAVPVVLGRAVLDRDDRILVDEVHKLLDETFSAERAVFSF